MCMQRAKCKQIATTRNKRLTLLTVSHSSNAVVCCRTALPLPPSSSPLPHHHQNNHFMLLCVGNRQSRHLPLRIFSVCECLFFGFTLLQHVRDHIAYREVNRTQFLILNRFCSFRNEHIRLRYVQP